MNFQYSSPFSGIPKTEKLLRENLLEILGQLWLSFIFLDDTDIPLRRLPLADSPKKSA